MIMEGAEPFFLPGGSMGVLLVHGFTGLPAELSMMGEYLQQRGCTVLGVRLAGHGTTVEDMSRMTAEDWLDSVRDGYALLRGSCERVVVAGHSMGGLLALLHPAQDIARGLPPLFSKTDGLVSPILRHFNQADPVVFAKLADNAVDRLLGQKTDFAQHFLRAVFVGVNRAENGQAGEGKPHGAGVILIRCVPFLKAGAVLADAPLQIAGHWQTPVSRQIK